MRVTKIHKKGLLISVILVSVLWSIIYFYIFNQPNSETKHIKLLETVAENKNVAIMQRNSKTFKIVYLTGDYVGKNWFGIGEEPFKQCRYKNCYTSSNMNDYSHSDAALVSWLHIAYLKQPLPTWRPPGQKWIMYLEESPQTAYIKQSNIKFNATMTYARNSEVHFPYGGVVKREKVVDYPNVNFTSKSKMVAWFVSNCKTNSKREKYAEELQRHIQVDVFGKCGKLECKRESPIYSNEDTCYKLLKTTYRFYLSFENSICVDYISEKLWNILQIDIIPIVLGGADYAAILPPHSYINIRDFSSVKDLATYLKNMDEKEYMKYFKWKQRYEVMIEPLPKPCVICQYLNKSANKTRVYEDMGQYWNRNSNCTNPDVFYKDIKDLKL
jgi:alpha-1,3-fucosyltransferase